MLIPVVAYTLVTQLAYPGGYLLGARAQRPNGTHRRNTEHTTLIQSKAEPHRAHGALIGVILVLHKRKKSDLSVNYQGSMENYGMVKVKLK